MNAVLQNHHRKAIGSFYTPHDVALALVGWAVRRDDDQLFDPSCGDGRFLALHQRSIGVERDIAAVAHAHTNAPHARIVACDFFEWVTTTRYRFEAAAGNPPFIRYQNFAGAVRDRALKVCEQLGVKFTRLTSSWAPFLAAATRVLKPGGRIAFVVPAEIGHAPYAAPLIEFLAGRFDDLRVVAIRKKLFPDLSEDAWLLFAEGFGGRTNEIRLYVQERFDARKPFAGIQSIVSLNEWRAWQCRLRPFLISEAARLLYLQTHQLGYAKRLQSIARTSIGYVTGANDFFHLRPATAQRLGIESEFLVPTVRNSKYLNTEGITHSTVSGWLQRNDPVLLLRLSKGDRITPAVKRYLESADAAVAKAAYKCRVRDPWYVVPDVRIPDAFLSYMSGVGPTLARNSAKCVCTNSVHAVTLTKGSDLNRLLNAWNHPLVRLSSELEGHPLGGGMLKLEPREAGQILIPCGRKSMKSKEISVLEDACTALRRWRHYE